MATGYKHILKITFISIVKKKLENKIGRKGSFTTFKIEYG